ncbi:MAG TPA: hypothetical protein VHJ78_08485 [Actinomycetota bacterium]|nr:hypothetical protein [Actinomycetota bacterium]
MTWKKKILAMMLAALSVFGVACGGGEEVEDDETEETTGDD